MTMDQMHACMLMSAVGYTPLHLPVGDDSPIPGVLLYAKPTQREIWMVRPDGSIVDLLKVHDMAFDCVRNWHEGTPPSLKLPKFVGDFRRLTQVAEAVNGKQPPDPAPVTPVCNIPPPPGGGL